MKYYESDNKALVRQLIQVNLTHKRMVEKLIAGTGVFRSQHQLLMYIASHEGQTQKEIADGLEVSPATTAVSIKKLEKGGFLKKVTDCEDNRNNRIEITEKGQQVVKTSYEIFNQVDAQMLKGFNTEEKEYLKNCLSRMKANLEEVHLEEN